MKIILLFTIILLGCSSKYSFKRNYKIGNKYSYKLTTYSQRGNNDQTKSVAYVEHTIVRNDSGIPSEKIKWKKFIGENSDVNYDSIIELIEPYEISLNPKGSVNLPPIPNPALTGIITDLNTFFVCLSPHTGIDKLSLIGDSLIDSKIRTGDFSDNKSILFGKDCLKLTQKLVGIKKDTVFFESKFAPPKDGSCETISYKDKIKPEKDENFIMLRKNGKNKVMFLKGKEDFTIKSKVDKKSGKLLYAEMTNNLDLNMKLNCTSTLDSCSQEYPYKIKRKLILEIQDKN